MRQVSEEAAKGFWRPVSVIEAKKVTETSLRVLLRLKFLTWTKRERERERRTHSARTNLKLLFEGASPVETHDIIHLNPIKTNLLASCWSGQVTR